MVAQEAANRQPAFSELGNLRPSSAEGSPNDVRLEGGQSLAPPLAPGRARAPVAPFRSDGPFAAAQPGGPRKAAAAPAFDLFDEAETGPAARQNVRATPVDPYDPALEQSSGARAIRSETNGRGPATIATVEETATDDGRLRGGLTLPAAPVRSVRTDTVDDRLNGRDGRLRGSLPPAVDDPFAPVGLRLGSALLYAALEQSVGVSTNLEETANGADGAFSDTTLELRAVSGWSRHEAEIDAVANYRRNFAGDDPEDPDVTVDGRLRLDVDHLTTATLRSGFIFRKEDEGDLDAGAEDDGARPDILNYSGSGEIERQLGDGFVRGTVSAARETTTGTDDPAAPLDEDFTTYTAALRASYRLSPAIAPFAEASTSRRLFDADLTALGVERDSTIQALRGGVAFDFSEKLRGEVAGGYAWNRPDATSLETAGAPTVDARIAWSPQRGTDVALTASTTFDPDTDGSGTATLYEGGLGVTHRATARLELEGALVTVYRDGEIATDTETTFGASAGFTYWLNRSLAFVGLASHRTVNRAGGASDYDVSTVKLGVRLQN